MLRKLILQKKFTPIYQQRIFFSNHNKKNLEDVKNEIEVSKRELNWRPKPSENPGAWNSKFKLFGNEDQTSDFITLMQQPIDLSPKSIKNWWDKRNENIERHMQSFIPERHQILGSDLATAHFVVFRGGAVKFLNNPQWVRKDDEGNFNLPNKYIPAFKLEAIKCDNMVLYYEGLENIRRLQNLKFLSFINVKTFDDWCLDRVSGSENPILEVLDLTGTNITYRGLSCIYRLTNLKVLVIDDPKSSKEMELTCALLEVDNHKLKVYASSEIHN
ncbi:distal membrane-arm assembly complex protein 2 [Condylostylus longicornis]|uniref:distal membrane-arm assembly complex protein 2 n=1 Tax=Condylostylus longicornis TaxID=2530218 RepID=UPI00244DBC95|nr:distal membrane-arm assembly complex protein 2 [Condylostylus longicornis]